MLDMPKTFGKLNSGCASLACRIHQGQQLSSICVLTRITECVLPFTKYPNNTGTAMFKHVQKAVCKAVAPTKLVLIVWSSCASRHTHLRRSIVNNMIDIMHSAFKSTLNFHGQISVMLRAQAKQQWEFIKFVSVEPFLQFWAGNLVLYNIHYT